MHRLRFCLLAISLLTCVACQRVLPMDAEITPAKTAVVINSRDPESVSAGAAYLAAYDIPPSNAIRVEVPVKDTLSTSEFLKLENEIQAKLPAQTNAIALLWSKPFRVDCMSITSAITFSADPASCASGCKRTRVNSWFLDPDGDLAGTRKQRRSMLVTGGSLDETLALILRGAAAQGNHPDGQAALVISGDRHRDVRQHSFSRLVADPPGRVIIAKQKGFVSSADDLMFYFTGAKAVPHLEELGFLPGAIGDHLTSHGGNLYGGLQMSALAWIQAGASGSYGTVAEPCNFVGKFPDPNILIRRYVDGDTLAGAYWASVEMPGQGVFIGDPLARPFSPRSAETSAPLE